MALGRALSSIGEDIFRLVAANKAEKQRQAELAEEQRRYQEESAFRTKQFESGEGEREFQRLLTRRGLNLGRGLTEEEAAPYRKAGIPTEPIQYTEPGFEPISPRSRFSLSPEEVSFRTGEERRGRAEERTEEEFKREQKLQAELEAFMADEGRSPEERERIKATRFAPGFKTDADIEREKKQRLAEIAAGQQDRISPEDDLAIRVAQATNPGANALPEDRAEWWRMLQTQFPRTFGAPSGPATIAPPGGGLSNLPAVSGGSAVSEGPGMRERFQEFLSRPSTAVRSPNPRGLGFGTTQPAAPLSIDELIRQYGGRPVPSRGPR